MASSLKKRIIRLGILGVVCVILTVSLFLGGVYYYLKLPTSGQLPVMPSAFADPNLLRAHVTFLAKDVFPRDALNPENLDRAALHIQSLFASAKARVRQQAYEVEGIIYRNVIAAFGPESGPMMVVGAHYDAYKELPGADDNASGVAVLLEIARLLGQHELKHRVELVAYSTEEPPFYGTSCMGSAIHAASLKETQTEVMGMICLEMVGFYSDVQPYPDDLLKKLYPDHGHFIGVIGRWQDRDLTRFIKKGFYQQDKLQVESVTMPMENSDHRNYWLENYQAVMITDTAMVRNPNYHTERDTPDTLDYENMAYIADALVSVLINLKQL